MPSLDIATVLKKIKIRVQLDRERLLREQSEVTVEFLTTRSQLALHYHPWHYIPGDQPVIDAGWDWVKDGVPARNLSVTELAENSWLVGSHRRASIDYMASIYGKFEDPLQATILTYAVSHGRRVILDGNHRSAHIAQSGRQFCIFAFCIKGPVDGAINPDIYPLTRKGVPLYLQKQVPSAVMPSSDDFPMGPFSDR